MFFRICKCLYMTLYMYNYYIFLCLTELARKTLQTKVEDMEIISLYETSVQYMLIWDLVFLYFPNQKVVS